MSRRCPSISTNHALAPMSVSGLRLIIRIRRSLGEAKEDENHQSDRECRPPSAAIRFEKSQEDRDWFRGEAVRVRIVNCETCLKNWTIVSSGIATAIRDCKRGVH